MPLKKRMETKKLFVGIPTSYRTKKVAENLKGNFSDDVSTSLVYKFE